MRVNRRGFLAGAATLASGLARGQERRGSKSQVASPEQLDRAAAAPVLKLDGLKSPVVVDSIRLLKKGNDFLVHVRSKDGAEGVSLTDPPRANYLSQILKQLVIPFFIGKDARDLENLLWELYRWQSNYKLYGLAFWCPQAWVEFAILDMLARVYRVSEPGIPQISKQ